MIQLIWYYILCILRVQQENENVLIYYTRQYIIIWYGLQKEYQIGVNDRMPSTYFDVSTWELFWSFTVGTYCFNNKSTI